MSKGKAKKILVTEDDNFLSKAIKDKLSRQGYRVIIAKDGDEALSKLQEQIFDLILLDLLMPGKDGFSVLEELKAKPELNKAPIIVLSNLGQSDDVNTAIELGATGYFIKSNTPIGQIATEVEKLMQ